jgi:hypothetical protein
MDLRERVREDAGMILIQVCVSGWHFVLVVMELQFVVWGLRYYVQTYRCSAETNEARHRFDFRY